MIKVFNATDKNYATHGDLILQPSKAVVHKEDNGEFYLDLETPLNEKEYKNTTPEAGQTAEGTSFSINVDTTKQYQVQTLKGQTTQSGTPTPTSPQPINITTGRQVVSVCGTNLFDGIFEQGARSNINGSAFNNANYVRSKNQTPVQPNTQYTIKCTFSDNTNGGDIHYLDANKTFLSRDTIGTLSTKTTPSNCYYINIQYYNANGITPSNVLTSQINKGNTDLPYEEYKGQDYEINLGKNLFNIDGTRTSEGLTNTTSGTIISVSGISTNTYSSLTNQITQNIPIGTYTFSIQETLSKRIGFIATFNDNTSTTYHITAGQLLTTFTTTKPIISYRLYIETTNGTQYDLTIKPQLEKGNVASSFSPYKTPIYLGKIGTYQDYIFRNTTENPLYDSNLEEGQWYIHKEIGRYDFTGTENFSASQWGTNSWDLENTISTQYNTNELQIMSNLFKGIPHANRSTGGNNIIYTYSNTGFEIRNTTYSTLTDIRNATKGSYIYWVLATPTTTLIEDEELINQLNSIELLEGLNNVSVSSANLPAILQLKYNFTTAYSNVIKYIDYLVPNNILVANTPQGDQAFRITNIEKTRRKIKLKANHVFYDTMNYLIADSYVVDKNCNDALDHLNNATSDLSPFTTISNITSINSYRCVRKSLYEAIQVVLERWGGHLVRNNWTLGIYDTIGQDNGVTIRYAKNLKDISSTYDWNEVITKLLPVGKDGLLLNEIDPDASIYVESATQYDIPYTKTVSFDQNNIAEDDYKDEEGTLDEDAYKQALVDDLYSKAMEYITNNYLPKVNYKLSANVEKVSDVGDRVEVIDEKLGINLMTNIISFDYDCILERYTQIEFGNFTPTLSNLMTQISVHTEEQINSSTQTLQITLNQELTDATDKIWNALGNSYVIYEGDKILVVDTLPKEEATNVIMINNGGIAFSNSGIDGTFSSAWTIDNVLNMEQINVINLTADLIKGGTLKLGSNLNQNGRLEVFDEANSLIAELNKDGLKMYGADGSYILMNNTVGFSGYDRLGNQIYWVDKDVFHQKKSEVEEEITLVKKMRIIPITIRDNNNQIVNDGIGFVNVGGGV